MLYKIISGEEIKLLEENNLVESLTEDELSQYSFSKGFFDIDFFSTYFLYEWKTLEDGTFIETPFFHKDIWKILCLVPVIDFVVIIARWHGKTTSVLIYILWRMLYFPKWSIIYLTEKWLGEKWVWKIKKELEQNELIKRVFGNLSPQDVSSRGEKKSSKWRQRELELLNGSRIEAVSKGQSIRGSRSDEVIGDDPEEDGDVKDRDRVKAFQDWFFKTIFPIKKSGGKISILGTIIGELCFVKYLRDEKNWMTLEYCACDENLENRLWDKYWTKKRLERERDGYWYKDYMTGKMKFAQGMGTTLFNQEYRNIPISRGERVIKSYWIRRYIPWIVIFDRMIMAIDPAVTEKQKSDFTGICILWISGTKRYVIYSVGIKASPTKLFEIIINIFNRFQPSDVVKEDNIEVKLTEDLKRKWLPIMWVKTLKDKHTRCLSVAWPIEIGDVLFRDKWDEELVNQLVDFPELKHDDVMDAFMLAMEYSQGELNQEEDGGDVRIINS